MDSLKLEFSTRLYNILSSIRTVSEVNLKVTPIEAESDDDVPYECSFCAKLFFDEHKFNYHNCRNRKTHRCAYGSCEKLFKKLSELRKHEVNTKLSICNLLMYSFILIMIFREFI